MFLTNKLLSLDGSSSEQSMSDILSLRYPELMFFHKKISDINVFCSENKFNIYIEMIGGSTISSLDAEYSSKISIGVLKHYCNDKKSLSIRVNRDFVRNANELIRNIFHIIDIHIRLISDSNVSLNLFISEEIFNCYSDIFMVIIHEYSESTENNMDAADTNVYCVGECADLNQLLFYNVYYKALCDSKNISNLPPNIATPDYMKRWVHGIFDHVDSAVCVESISPDSGEFVFTNNFKDVDGKGPEIVKIEYIPDSEVFSHVVLVGKGVTFDAGGMALKDIGVMQMMKYDKIGAVMSVLITYIAAVIKLPIKISTVAVFCENILRSDSIKPGSVYATNNAVVDVNNPDGEGRLLLADCLEYIHKFEPVDYALTIATLTGDSYNVFGDVMTPYFCNSSNLKDVIEAASVKSQDKVWMMPIDEEFEKYLSSNNPIIIKNYANSVSKLITSGYFISKFAEKYNWAHFDMAGVSIKDNRASGRPLLLLINILISLCD